MKKTKKVTAPAMGVKGKAEVGTKGLPKMKKGGIAKAKGSMKKGGKC